MSASLAWLSSHARASLAVIAALGAALRVAACFRDGPLHPDEYFQYLEPAWWRLTGAGQETWEWMDGVRSWILPFYNGAWLAALLALGMPRGPALVWSIKVHWALVNVCSIFIAYRGAAFVARRMAAQHGTSEPPETHVVAGLLGASLVACFPLLVLYSAHTLSELPSMLCLLAGLVLAAELTEHAPEEWTTALRNKAIGVGFLLSLGACLRIANAPMVLLPPAWLLATRRYRALAFLLWGATVPALVFALVDLVTWGTLAGSFVGYVKFNLIEGKAANFGTEPVSYYFVQLWRRLPFSLALLLVPALWGLRATWPFLGSAALALGYLSTQAHKEERFIVLVWPLLLMAAAGVGAWLVRAAASRVEHVSTTPHLFAREGMRPAVVALCAGFVLLDGALHAGGREWPLQSRLDAQAWTGKQRDVTGLLIDYPIDAAGGVWFGNDAPHLKYSRALLDNPLISHVLVASDSKRERDSLAAGFVRVHRTGGFVVLRRSEHKP